MKQEKFSKNPTKQQRIFGMHKYYMLDAVHHRSNILNYISSCLSTLGPACPPCPAYLIDGKTGKLKGSWKIWGNRILSFFCNSKNGEYAGHGGPTIDY